MLSPEQIKQIISENEYLQVQLQDVNEVIAIREEELEILRAKARKAVELKSQLEGTFNELSQMQAFIGQKQQEAAGAARREAAMEDEVIQSIHIEKEYYTIREKLASASAAMEDINSQLSDAKHLYKELADAKARITELESMAGIMLEENELLQYELAKAKKIASALKEGL